MFRLYPPRTNKYVSVTENVKITSRNGGTAKRGGSLRSKRGQSPLKQKKLQIFWTEGMGE